MLPIGAPRPSVLIGITIGLAAVVVVLDARPGPQIAPVRARIAPMEISPRVTSGIITTVIGTGEPGFTGDGGSATGARINRPVGIAVAANGDIYFVDNISQRVRRVSGGVITTVAGSSPCDEFYNCFGGYGGDNQLATVALLNNPHGIALDASGHLYIADTWNHRVRRVHATTGIITTVAGDGTWTNAGEDVPATGTGVPSPVGLAVDGSGGLYIAEQPSGGGEAWANRVRRVDLNTGLIRTIAGTDDYGYNGDGIAATTARLWGPAGVHVHSGGDVYIADQFNHRVRRVSGGVITTVAGNGTWGFSGDGGAATAAQLNQPLAVLTDSQGNLYISDRLNNRVRMVRATDGTIVTIAGSITDALGDGGPATEAGLWNPFGLAFGSGSALLISDMYHHRVRRVELIGLNDTTPPEIAVTVTGTLGLDNWYTSNVTVAWTVTDPDSSITSTTGCSAANLTVDTTGTDYTCTATSGGGTSSRTVTIKRDATQPSVTLTTPPEGANYSLNQAVAAGFSCSDATSGLASCVGTVANGANISTSPAGDKTFTVTGTDRAGLTRSVTHHYAVAKAAPVITWNDPAGITYGTALSGAQLNATANVAGTFVYDPPAGTVLDAGQDRPLMVTFTPADLVNYTVATKTVHLDVGKAAPILTWPAPAPLVYGTPLGASQLNATANVAGSFLYTPASGVVLSVGHHTLSVTFTPEDGTNYTQATSTVTIDVTHATPVITWANPAAITYGTPLGAAQLNATANVPGTFVYTPPAGEILEAGAGQVLSVFFSPNDVLNYSTANATVTIDVLKATPVITWPEPAAITYGTPLGGGQLNATVPQAGTLIYTPSAGTVLPVGNDQVLSVTFTPADGANYTPATRTVTLDVVPATPPTLTSVSPPAGPVSGGTVVTLTGTGFLPGATVTVGGAPATSVTVLTSTRITATTPPHAAGSVAVVVTNGDGNSATLAGGFTFGGGTGTAVRMMNGCYIAGGGFLVTIAVSPGAGVVSYAVEDLPPGGWGVSDVSDGGVFDAATGKVKFGLFLDGLARTLTYVVTPPASASGLFTFAGVASFDGHSEAITGTLTSGPCETHPADLNSNWRVVIDEMTAYGAAWKRGEIWTLPPNPIPIDFVTRGGFLWRAGEAYHRIAGDCPLCWVPGAPGGPSLQYGDREAGRASTLQARVRRVPRSATWQVTITARPAASTLVWAAEDSLPPGWVPLEASDGAGWDPQSRTLRWGPFFDAGRRLLTYTMTPVGGASGSLVGRGSVDGHHILVRGARQVRVGRLPTALDFTGDGYADLALVDPVSGAWFIPGLDDVPGPDAPGWTPVPADFDGDGRTDPAAFDPATAGWRIGSGSPEIYGEPGDRPVPADYDGDGAADFAVFRPATGTWSIVGADPVTLGEAGDQPVPADFDGDGTAEPTVFRPATGEWIGLEGRMARWGREGDIPVPADYDGDGAIDRAVFRLATGEWLVDGIASRTWRPGRSAGTVPVACDLDGDGAADPCVFNEVSGVWTCRTADGRLLRASARPGSRPAGARK